MSAGPITLLTFSTAFSTPVERTKGRTVKPFKPQE